MDKIFAALVLALTFGSPLASADEYSETIGVFKNAGESADFFKTSYGYAVFPTIGKGGLGVGAAHGDGKVYEKGKYIGDTSMTQVSVGFQAGGEAFSQIIFFQNKGALDQFTSGNFEFSADVGAVAIKSGVSGDGHRQQRRRASSRHGRQLSQGNGSVHSHEGWSYGSSHHRRPEV